MNYGGGDKHFAFKARLQTGKIEESPVIPLSFSFDLVIGEGTLTPDRVPEILYC